MKTWIKLEGENEPFRVEISAEADVADLRKAVLAEKPHTLKGLASNCLVVHANKETYEKSVKGGQEALPLEGTQLIGILGRTVDQALFISLTQPKDQILFSGMKDVWIQLKGEKSFFSVEVKEDCSVEQLRDAILAKKSRTLKGLQSSDLTVYEDKQTYERSIKGDIKALPMEGTQPIGILGQTYGQALFVMRQGMFDIIKSLSGPEMEYFIALAKELLKNRPYDIELAAIIADIFETFASNHNLTEIKQKIIKSKDGTIVETDHEFLFVENSSGTGKTMLPFILQLKFKHVVHLLGQEGLKQDIYREMGNLSDMFLRCVKKDLEDLSKDRWDIEDLSCSNLKDKSLHTFSFLKLIKRKMMGENIEGESFEVDPSKVESFFDLYDSKDPYSIPLIFLDEFPKHVEDNTFARLMRNILRASGAVVFIMGTNCNGREMLEGSAGSRGSEENIFTGAKL